MDVSRIPRALALLIDERNPAADAAIVEALPTLSPDARAHALGILFQRSATLALTELVSRFHSYDDALRRLLLGRTDELSVGLRTAAASSVQQSRINAIVIIVVSGKCEHAVVLADALRSSCSQTRSLAAKGLLNLTSKQIRRIDGTHHDHKERRHPSNRLTEAICLAIRRGAIDSFPNLLAPALLLGKPVESVVMELAKDARTGVVQHLCGCFQHASDLSIAGMALRALGEPTLAKPVSQSILQNTDRSFLRGLIASSWQMSDPKIEKGCRLLRDHGWVRVLLDEVLIAEGSGISNGARLVMTAAGTKESKTEVVRDLLGSERSEIRHAAVMALAEDDSDMATHWLALASIRYVDETGAVALREWRKRQIRSGKSAHLQYTQESVTNQMFERCWRHHSTFDDAMIAKMADPVEYRDLHSAIRAKLASVDPVDRARALRICAALKLQSELELVVQRLAQDNDAIVRSLAVNLLGEIKTFSKTRVLRSRVEDPDVRVQANSIDVLDRLDLMERVQWIYPKLASPNSRVRANSVRTLLREGVTEASEVLIDMLEHRYPSQRISGLWVVESLGLHSAANRIGRLAREDPDAIVRRKAARTCQILADRARSQQELLLAGAADRPASESVQAAENV